MPRVIVIGAGAAGLAAARALKHAGFAVTVLEASNRVGGRAHTIYDTNAGIPIELGAEFVHGEARETYRLLDEARLATVPVLGHHYRSRAGKFDEQERVWKRLARVFRRMDPDRKQDRSFQEFLDTKPGGPFFKEARALALGFVQGFNGADPWRISEKSLAEQGNPTAGAAKSARIINGYAALMEHLQRDLVDVVHFNSVVNRILWDESRVRVLTRAGAEFKAAAVIVTVPLPMLQDDSIVIEPELPRIRKAARLLVMGHVAHVSVVVKERFWERKVDELAFVHTPERPFNVWWTNYPVVAPVIVGWSGGPPAVELAQRGNVEDVAVRELARTFGLRRARLEPLIDSMHAHDWSADSYAGGAYSYVGVGGVNAPKQLAQPVRDTLFFAGEATVTADSGTVEGAIASGLRAARQVIKSQRAG